MSRATPQEQLARLAKREAVLKRQKAKLKQAERRLLDLQLREAGQCVAEGGLLDWPREKLLAAFKSLAKRGAE